MWMRLDDNRHYQEACNDCLQMSRVQPTLKLHCLQCFLSRPKPRRPPSTKPAPASPRAASPSARRFTIATARCSAAAITPACRRTIPQHTKRQTHSEKRDGNVAIATRSWLLHSHRTGIAAGSSCNSKSARWWWGCRKTSVWGRLAARTRCRCRRDEFRRV